MSIDEGVVEVMVEEEEEKDELSGELEGLKPLKAAPSEEGSR